MNYFDIFKKLKLVLLAPLGYLIFFISSFFPGAVENLYSNGIFRLITRVLSILTGYIPFSVAEFIYVSVIIFVLIKLILMIIKIFKCPSQTFKTISNQLVNAIVAISIIYFSFILLWGINYQRLPFGETANLDTSPASIEELAIVCENLLSEANYLRDLVEEDENGVMKLSSDKQSTLKRAHLGFDKAADYYPTLYGKYGRPKGIILSELMSYSGIGGVYFPFTGEANVNISVPHSTIPFTTCHEIAHQIGYAREDEANFIGYITCKFHPDIDFQYSGTLLALRYATSALFAHNPERFQSIRDNYSDGVLRDLRAISAYWQKYETPVQEISSSINDTYLRANMQKDGIQSYGRMVDLLIAEHRKYNN
ncbi:UNVERIFIED_CONTAM: uncharacterized protein DUF3810 [Acetivibrio alkalicellulosi]